MKMSDLPSDLEEEILFRVPATSLKRVRSTRKRWNALFKEPGFSEKHFLNAPRHPRVLMLKEHRLFPTSVDLNVVPPSIEFKDALSLQYSNSNDSEQVDIVEVFHCDGLLLCITKENRPVVWNPCSGETRWIRQENGYDRDCRFALGYENNQSCRSYRILRFYERNEPVARFEIYELSSNSWRVVNAPDGFRISIRFRGVTLKGNTYWISSNGEESNYLLSFDFARERFRRMCLPTSFQDHVRINYMALSVVRDEKLSVLGLNRNSIGSSKIEMWVSKRIDASEAEFSWTKLFAVDSNTCGDLLDVFTSLLIDEEKRVALCCNSYFGNNRKVVYTIGEDDEYYTQAPYIKEPWALPFSPCNSAWWPFIFNYVPSLVQI